MRRVVGCVECFRESSAYGARGGACGGGGFHASQVLKRFAIQNRKDVVRLPNASSARAPKAIRADVQHSLGRKQSFLTSNKSRSMSTTWSGLGPDRMGAG